MVVCVGNELRFQGLGSKMLTSFSLPPSSFRAICLCRPRPTFADRGVSASSKYLFPYMTGQGAPTNPAPPMFGREPLRRPYSLPGSSIPKQLSGGHFGGGAEIAGRRDQSVFYGWQHLLTFGSLFVSLPLDACCSRPIESTVTSRHGSR